MLLSSSAAAEHFLTLHISALTNKSQESFYNEAVPLAGCCLSPKINILFYINEPAHKSHLNTNLAGFCRERSSIWQYIPETCLAPDPIEYVTCIYIYLWLHKHGRLGPALAEPGSWRWRIFQSRRTLVSSLPCQLIRPQRTAAATGREQRGRRCRSVVRFVLLRGTTSQQLLHL